MEYILSELEPNAIYRYFEELCAIPHGSSNEGGVADWLVGFAKEHELECYRDELHNVLIKKNGSEGNEDLPALLIQGHTDMVCEKNADTVHDFEKEGLKLRVKDGWLYAEGTTLGADDGVAVALMMAVLADKNAVHPPLECLFTVQEETGMGGVYGFDFSKLTAKEFINLDSESLDVATLSCAGGVQSDIFFEFDEYKVANTPVVITIKGLAGGHSGVDINTGKANANLLMGRILADLYEDEPFNLISINGGSKANAIPRECVAVVSVFDHKAAKARVKQFAEVLKKELVKDDRRFTVKVERAKEPVSNMFSFKDTSKIISCLNLVPNGVLSMRYDVKDLVESSSNLGIVETAGNKIKLVCMPRSSSESRLDCVIMKIDALCKALGARAEHSARYPGWEYNPKSRVRDMYAKVYCDMFGKKPLYEFVHAGLECGIISDAMGGMDGISIGAEILDIHTPDERLNLESFAQAYTLLCGMLKEFCE